MRGFLGLGVGVGGFKGADAHGILREASPMSGFWIQGFPENRQKPRGHGRNLKLTMVDQGTNP